VVPDSRSLGAVISDIADNVREIFRGELRLAGAELVANVRPFQRGLVLLVLAGILAIAGLGYLLLSGLFALALVLPLWAAALIMALAVLVMAGLLAWAALRRFRQVRGFPRTLTSLQDTTRWPQHSTH
jgi:uncharacterized membrane protein YqjE